MNMNVKAMQVLDLLTQLLGGMNLVHHAADNLHEFEARSNGVAHRVCYPDEVIAQRKPKELALVAASILNHLHIDPEYTRVVIRAGMFEIMLQTLESGSAFPVSGSAA